MLKNTSERYGTPAKLFHWVIGVLIILLLAIGLRMVALPMGPDRLMIYGYHKIAGLTVLLLVVLRVCWRLANVIPKLPEDMPGWQKFAARCSHYALYFFMFAMPITGWMMTSAAGFPVSVFGLFTMPTIIAPDPELRVFFNTAHEYLAYALIAMICLHAGAALYHHFIRKDGVLRSMWFGKQSS